ncbi:efflux transporter periplasmic adaptor subunit [Roseateles aquatilis]|uniref:Efflux transporter periplasmic adaptor subunit n=1 Tax=Roseateles aquatilis TaxID=431061 RepID=A0A246JI49_9BURK|nr:efflux RND transporter periplasmic adaptor subunit [Roseateles aquatilis]OWQ92242.1 efflux transporter periplasmic adaptor subunit [Roseateles aquatilis]
MTNFNEQEQAQQRQDRQDAPQRRGGLGRKQAIAIAVLIAIGIGGGAAILLSGPASPAKGGEHGEHGGKDDGHGHGKEDAHADKGKDAHADKEAHGGKDTHAEKEGAGHAHDDHDDHAKESGQAKSEGQTEGKGDAHGEGKDDGHGHGEGAGKKEAGAAEAIAMTEAQIKAAAIVLDSAGPALIRTTTQLPGEIGFDEDRTAHVVPRVTGVVEAVPAVLGQAVRKGDLLAVIASAQVSDQRSELLAAQKRLQLARTTHEREQRLWEEKISPRQDVDVAEQALREAEIAVANVRQKLQAVGALPGGGALNRYELRAPFDGTVVEKHIALGEQVKEDASVFVLSDLRTVWARVDVPAGDLPKVRVGERAVVKATAFEQSIAGTIAYVGPLIGGQSRTAQARVALPNPERAWRPGLFVNVDLVTGEAQAPVTVAADAVQTFEDRPVVFVRTAEGFVAQPVRTGRSDGRRTEVLQGLKPGARYAARNAFVIKSEAGKGSATHSH